MRYWAWMVVACLAFGARAQDLTIAIGGAVTTMDPHFQSSTPNWSVAAHVFDRLVHLDDRQRPGPGLAIAWQAIDDLTWEFTLRPGVRFHDGAAFEAEDVAASYRRVVWVPNSPSSFAPYVRAIRAVEIVTPHLIRIRTTAPHPLLPRDLAAVSIVPRGRENAPTAAFNDASAAIGTGPYRLVRFVPGERVEFERHPGWWGGAPAWRRVTMRVIAQDQARVAALLAGDAAVIDFVPPQDLARLSREPLVAIARARSARVFHLSPDVARARSPFITDRAGAPIDNPMRDARVRRAVSLAINRAALVERINDGLGQPAGDVVPEDLFGANPALRADAFDPERARALLAQAGFAGGLRLTLHASNDRYVNDERVAQAIGAMLTRVGIETAVEALPWTVYVPRARRLDFSLTLWGSLATTGEASGPLRLLLGTFDAASGLGASNTGRYANPRFDAVLGRALITIDDRAREGLLREASAIALGESAIIPLYFQDSAYATRRDLALNPRADDQVWAMNVRPR